MSFFAYNCYYYYGTAGIKLETDSPHPQVTAAAAVNVDGSQTVTVNLATLQQLVR